MKKFDFVIGNPPYQENNERNGRQAPVYHLFMEEGNKVARVAEFITPARFLFNAGQTPKHWNKKMLNDDHFKVLRYYPDARKVFPMTEIKGGVAITIRNEDKHYGSITVFNEHKEMNSFLNKVLKHSNVFLDEISIGAVPYKYTEKVRHDYPHHIEIIGDSFDLRTNAFEKMSNILFFDEPISENMVKVYGLYNRERCYKWIREDYLIKAENFNNFKVFISKASGSGNFGEALSEIEIGEPEVAHTQSFISMGNFENKEEAINLKKYIKTKFARALLSILRRTQDTTPYKWKYVPLQDFTSNSDIDWSKSISEIDQQLYNKYGLSQDEIDFIETNVQEMK